MKRVLMILLGLFLSTVAFSQDAQYSTYYANPLYLNPGFTGATQSQRLVINHRNQWPNIPIAYQTYSASYDVNASALKSGFGIQFNGDKSGSVGLRSSQINLLYSYKIRTENFMISPAVSFGYGTRSLDYNKLLFGDQLSFMSSQTPPPSLDPALFDIRNVNYFDFSSGIVFYNKDIWLGFAAWHMNQPNRTFLKQTSPLPMKVSIHGGIRLEFGDHMRKGKKEAIVPSFLYLKQAQFDQLDLGTMFIYEPVTLGVWYRGIPIRQNVSDQISQDAVVIMLGFQTKRYEIYYSYDATVSRLAGVSGGAHEISFKYQFLYDLWKVKHKKAMRYIPCPAF